MPEIPDIPISQEDFESICHTYGTEFTCEPPPAEYGQPTQYPGVTVDRRGGKIHAPRVTDTILLRTGLQMKTFLDLRGLFKVLDSIADLVLRRYEEPRKFRIDSTGAFVDDTQICRFRWTTE